MKTQYVATDIDSVKKLNDLGFEARLCGDANPDSFLGDSVVVITHNSPEAKPIVDAFIESVKSIASEVRVSQHNKKAPEGHSVAMMDEDTVDKYVFRAETLKPVVKRRRNVTEFGVGRFAGERIKRRWLCDGKKKGVGFMAYSEPILWAGRGGIGKSHSALEFAFVCAIANATGKPQTWAGMTVYPRGVVVVFTYEDSYESAQIYAQEFAEAYGVDLETLNEHLFILLMSEDFDGAPFVSETKGEGIGPTQEYMDFTQDLRKLKRHKGQISLLVIDGVGQSLQADNNSYSSVYASGTLVNRWCRMFDATTLLLSHTSKVDAGKVDIFSNVELQKAVLGSVGWVNLVRQVGGLFDIPEDQQLEIANLLDDKDFKPHMDRYVYMTMFKTNIKGVDMERRVMKRDGVKLLDVTEKYKEKKKKGFIDSVENIAILIGREEAIGKMYSKSGKGTSLADSRKAFGEPWSKMTRDQIRNTLEIAIERNLVSDEAEDPKNPRRKGLLTDLTGKGKKSVFFESLMAYVRLENDKGRTISLEVLSKDRKNIMMPDSVSEIYVRDIEVFESHIGEMVNKGYLIVSDKGRVNARSSVDGYAV